jgi:hypothetical protein
MQFLKDYYGFSDERFFMEGFRQQQNRLLWERYPSTAPPVRSAPSAIATKRRWLWFQISSNQDSEIPPWLALYESSRIFEEHLWPLKGSKQLKRFSIGRQDTAKKRATVIPETGEGPPEPVKRDEGFSAPLAGSMAFET